MMHFYIWGKADFHQHQAENIHPSSSSSAFASSFSLQYWVSQGAPTACFMFRSPLQWLAEILPTLLTAVVLDSPIGFSDLNVW